MQLQCNLFLPFLFLIVLLRVYFLQIYYFYQDIRNDRRFYFMEYINFLKRFRVKVNINFSRTLHQTDSFSIKGHSYSWKSCCNCKKGVFLKAELNSLTSYNENISFYSFLFIIELFLLLIFLHHYYVFSYQILFHKGGLYDTKASFYWSRLEVLYFA